MLDKSDALFNKALPAAADNCQAPSDCSFSKGTCRPGCGGLAIRSESKARYEKAAAEALA
ncbi:MAG: hypothetical protein JRI23_31295, partial [Deltaproteobacteria bacterium]|nr:hypothetical protein [Deltaproteobacteria bacterium]MBW2536691.1 hypothetical protein [Deltaproteobacteria bacterium]